MANSNGNDDLKNAILQLTELISQQQQQISALQRTNGTADGSEKIIESLASGIQEFDFDPDGPIFFNDWYARYEDVFKEDGRRLDEAAKVRLLLRKLSLSVHEKYVNSILPKHPRDFTLDETVTKLKKLFGRQKSIFHARYQCLQYSKNEADDFTSYAAMVNKHCEAFQLSKLSSDQFKALRFICGLQSPRDADIRARLITKLEADEAATANGGGESKVSLENLVEECHRIANLKQDTQMVESKDTRSVNAIARNQTQPVKKIPKTPCWNCGDLHYTRDCPFITHTCVKCKKQGHKEGYCFSAKPSTSKNFSEPLPKENFKANSIHTVRNIGSKRKFVPVHLNGVKIQLQHDSASDITVISEQTWDIIGRPATQATEEQAVTASGHSLHFLAELKVDITISNVTKEGRIFIADNPDLNILGIETMDLFDLWSIPINSLVNAVHQRPDKAVEKLKQEFSEVFQPTLGRCTKAQVKLYLKPDAHSIYCPKRPVAYAAAQKVEAKLQRLQNDCIKTTLESREGGRPPPPPVPDEVPREQPLPFWLAPYDIF